MNAALATLPVLVTLGLLGFRVRALYAGLAALATAALLTATAFRTPPTRLMSAQLQMLPTAVELSAILFGGLLLSELMSRTGAQNRLGDRIGGAVGSPARAVLLVVLGVTPFAESLTGFGIGVIVAIPLLRRLGLPPAKAAVVGLLGLVTVPWGSLGTGSLVAVQLGGVDFQDLGVHSALLSAPIFLIAGAAALVITFGLRGAVASWLELLLSVGALWVTLWAVNTFLGVPLAGVLGGLAAIVAMLLGGRRRGTPRTARPRAPIARPLAPYGFLVAGLLAGRALLEAAGIREGWWTVVAGPAGWLLLTAALTPWLLGAAASVLPAALGTAVRRWWQVALTTVLFLALGALLTVTGMSREIAQAGAALGPGYLLLAPWIGAVGGFLAGSNTGANAMFAASQAGTAQLLGYSTVQLVAVQNVSAALASSAALARVELAVQLAERAEGARPVPASVPAPRVPAGVGGRSAVPVPREAGVRAAAAVAPVDSHRVLRTVLAVYALGCLMLGGIALVVR